MTVDADEFFKGKRPWSRIKDHVLGQYMSPYLAKISKRPEQMLLIDAFAGPGKFEDDDSAGSPLIICRAADKYAKGRYNAFFVNERKEHHQKLDAILHKANWTPNAQAIHGDAQDLLKRVGRVMTSQSVFIYLDPFGLKDCAFNTLRPFLDRQHTYSTEIMINLNITGIHRLAAHDKVKSEGKSPLVQQWHDILTSTLGGSEWEAILLSDNAKTTKEKEREIVELYKSKLAETNYLTYHGDCPVMNGDRTQYHMIFASSHPDSKYLLNDPMCKAFNEAKHSEEVQGTFFEGVHWSEWHDIASLKTIILDRIKAYPGRTRLEVWRSIIDEHFMRFTGSEYKDTVKGMVNQMLLTVRYTNTGRLNDDCLLFI